MEYEVEKILQRAKIKGKTHYLVLWQGYAKSEATWEPLVNLEHCPEKIEEFEKQIKNKLGGKQNKSTKQKNKSSKKTNENSSSKLQEKQTKKFEQTSSNQQTGTFNQKRLKINKNFDLKRYLQCDNLFQTQQQIIFAKTFSSSGAVHLKLIDISYSDPELSKKLSLQIAQSHLQFKQGMKIEMLLKVPYLWIAILKHNQKTIHLNVNQIPQKTWQSFILSVQSSLL